MRLDPFRVALLAGGLFTAALVWSIATADDRQVERAQAAGLASGGLEIKEITCTVCRGAITDKLGRTNGVHELTTDRKGLTVAYDAARTDPEALAGIVRGLGYTASVRPAR